MQQILLFSFFLGFSRANDCKNWRRSLAFEDPRPKGSTLFLVTTSAMYKCSIICSQSEKCAIFSFDQRTGHCTGFQSFMISTNVLSVPAEVFYKVVQLTVTIKTGTGNGAAADSKVFLKLYGSFGATSEIELVDSTPGHSKFESGATDYFVMTSVDVGTLQRVKIGHDNSIDPRWILDIITISVDGKSGITFEVKGWMEGSTQYRTIEAP